ncbi:type II secretion system F family protein [Burkholderia gladioli]|uniref:type II secretion system F family protein n=1 Tax=Burkholderia gladioli TaxID=28095 RepID=UPI0034DB6B94
MNFSMVLRRSLGLPAPSAPSRRAKRQDAGLPWSVRARFYENAIELLPEGQPPSRILHLLSQELVRLRRKKNAQAAHRAAQAIEDGSPISTALGSRISDLERNLLEIGEMRAGVSHRTTATNVRGEEEGGLVSMMRDILDARARMLRLTEVAWGSLFEPIVYLLTMYGFFYVLGQSIMPNIELLLPRERWDDPTKLLNAMGWFGTGLVPIVLAAVAACIIAATVFALPRWSGRGRVMAERFIFVFAFYRELHGMLWMLGFAVQVKNGVAEADAIAQQIRAASPWLASRLRPLYHAIVQGHPIGEALRETGHAFPSPGLIERIAVLENGHADALERMARLHIDRLEKRMRVLARTIGFVSLGGIFAVIGMVQYASSGLSTNMATAVGF